MIEDADPDQSPYGMVFPQDQPAVRGGAAGFRRVGGMDLLEYYTGKALAGILAGIYTQRGFGVVDLHPAEEENVGRQAVRSALSALAALERERKK